MKHLPIGIQTLGEIINSGYVYVDKTALVKRLITEGKYYFLARPRRFGKSLLVDTLKSIFSGYRELFKECYIFKCDYSWQRHPIIHLDFTQLSSSDPRQLEASLKLFLEDTASSCNKTIKVPSLEYGLADLVKKLSEEGKVVVLIDEYDKPLIDKLNHKSVAESNRDILKNFFGTLKGLDSYLKFVFVTGVSKFSHGSLFSGFNNLEDITTAPDYATLLGYTEQEIHQFFRDRIQLIAKQRSEPGPSFTESQVKAEMRHWYNGYRFSWGAATVYNPHSTLNYLKTRRTENYWFQTGTPTFLIKEIKKQSYPLDKISGVEVGDELFRSFDFDNINLISLMWQTGYLTIINYDPLSHIYSLDYPNEEVRVAFLKELVVGLSQPSFAPTVFAHACIKSLENEDLELFFSKIKTFFADIPYDIHLTCEKYYQTIFYVIAKLMGLEAQVEVKTNLGRIDMTIEVQKIVYILEFKIDSKAQKSLDQIEDKKYYEKYLDQSKKLVLVGVNFCTKERNITDWKASLRK